MSEQLPFKLQLNGLILKCEEYLCDTNKLISEDLIINRIFVSQRIV